MPSSAPSRASCDFGDRAAVGLESLDCHQLQQVASAVERGSATHGGGPVEQADRGVPADGPPVRHLADAAVGLARVVNAQRFADELGELVDGPLRFGRHAAIVTLLYDSVNVAYMVRFAYGMRADTPVYWRLLCRNRFGASSPAPRANPSRSPTSSCPIPDPARPWCGCRRAACAIPTCTTARAGSTTTSRSCSGTRRRASSRRSARASPTSNRASSWC